MGDRRRSFRRLFKLKAVRLVTDGGLSLFQAARDFGYRRKRVRALAKATGPGPCGGFPRQGAPQVPGRGVATLEAGERNPAPGARHFSKNSSGHLLAGAQMKYQFVRDHRDRYPVRRMCLMLDISTSTNYAGMISQVISITAQAA